MRVLIIKLGLGSVVLGGMLCAVGVLGAQQGPFVPIPAQQLQLQALPPAPPVSVTANYVGTQGPNTFTYYVVARYPRGQSPLSVPAQISNVGAISAGNSVRISWTRALGATSYDVLKLAGGSQFLGMCSACLLINVADPTVTTVDTGGALAAYTLAAVGIVNGTLSIDNQSNTFPFLSMILGGSGTTNFRIPLVSTFTAGSLVAFDSRGNLVNGAGGAPVNATYITQTPNATLTNEQALSLLGTNPLKVTTGTGVVSSGQINLASEVTGNLPVGNLAGGVGAGATTFWRGDGSWGTPAGTGLPDPGSNGIVVRTGAGPTDTVRTITAGTGISVNNGDGVAGNPTINTTDGVCPAGANTQVQYTDGTDCQSDADLTFDGNFLHLGTGTTKGIRFGDNDSGFVENGDDALEVTILSVAAFNFGQFINSSRRTFNLVVAGSAASPPLVFNSDFNSGFYQIGADNFAASVNGAKRVEYGGSQDWLLQDTTAVTGETTGIVRAGAGQTDANALVATQDNSSNPLWRVTGLGTAAGRPSQNATSAATTTLAAGNLFHITGTTNITALNTCDATNNGREVALIFDDVLTFTDGGNLILAGNFVTTANDVIKLVCDGSNWYEISRSVN